MRTVILIRHARFKKMGKLKYAFIMESKTLTPDTHTVIHENRDNYDIVAAVNSLKMAEDLAQKLAEEGFSNIDLCGAFDEMKASKVAAATDGKIDVRYTKYTPEDSKRMDSMESLKEYGIILMEGPIPETEWLYMKSDEFNTTIALVNSLDSACAAAGKMVEDGIIFIEMCRWFDEEKAKAVISTIDGAVPVGYCG